MRGRPSFILACLTRGLLEPAAVFGFRCAFRYAQPHEDLHNPVFVRGRNRAGGLYVAEVANQRVQKFVKKQ
jgi:hypothetical protein